MKTPFLVRLITRMNYGAFIETWKSVKKKSKKNGIFLFFDMIYCGLVYQSGYIEYDIFQFYRLNAKQRDSYITRGRLNTMIRRLNDPKNWNQLANKADFDEKFKDFIHRDFLDLRNATVEDVWKFVEGREYIIGKVLNGSCGKGIHKLKISDYHDAQSLFDDLHNKNIGLIEELVIQHPVLAAIHPFSVNTLRVMTIVVDDVVHIPCVYLRIGNGKHVDNLNSGGFGAVVDVKTGIVPLVAVDKDGHPATHHPLTGTAIVGAQMPMFDEVKELCRKAARVVEGIRIVGWDVCVTEKGPLLIEGNPFPGNDLTQLPAHMLDGYGRYHQFMDIIEGRIKTPQD
ncbi:MAG TPA: hypothetical protein DCQ90_01455 [Erysipelotrichaceae bacterium]|nr:hypothetical protein [Erysipelotrichaceae bacterium]